MDDLPTRLRDSLCGLSASRAKLVLEAAGEIERLHSWKGLMSLLDEHYPSDIFEEGPLAKEPGTRIFTLIREVDRLKAIVEEHIHFVHSDGDSDIDASRYEELLTGIEEEFDKRGDRVAELLTGIERLQEENLKLWETATSGNRAIKAGEAVALELIRLQKIVDTLPKCWGLTDGVLVKDVLVVPGVVLWHVSPVSPTGIIENPPLDDWRDVAHVEDEGCCELYNSEVAAQAALDAKENKS